jgi:hypothetical protein
MSYVGVTREIEENLHEKGKAAGPRSQPARVRGRVLKVRVGHDSGPGSLRHALANANNLDTINFAVTGTIALTSGGLQVTKNVAISGPGSNPVLEKRVLSQPSG